MNILILVVIFEILILFILIIYPDNEKGTSINFMQNGNLSGAIKNGENKTILNVGEGNLKMVVNSKVRLSGLIFKPE